MLKAVLSVANPSRQHRGIGMKRLAIISPHTTYEEYLEQHLKGEINAERNQEYAHGMDGQVGGGGEPRRLAD